MRHNAQGCNCRHWVRRQKLQLMLHELLSLPAGAAARACYAGHQASEPQALRQKNHALEELSAARHQLWGAAADVAV